jgi:hypothetical protein
MSYQDPYDYFFGNATFPSWIEGYTILESGLPNTTS